MNDIEKTKHYTSQSEIICGNLVSYIPQDAQLIEPFVGGGDLLNLFPNANWEKYDIAPQTNSIQQDTLQNPPDYHNKWVITNPPYLAKNKAKDKILFNKYQTDDLYKIALLTILDCEGGILIIPTNFFTDERTAAIRKQFLNQFQILEMNIFTEPVFTTTTYSVCSFAFKRKNTIKKQEFLIHILPKNEATYFTIEPEYNYRFAGDFFQSLENVNNIFGRLVGKTSTDYITNIKLYAIDTRNSRIRLEFNTTPYEGKDSDRTYATFTCKYKLTEEQEKLLINEFNEQLENFRKQYYDLPMTNYRDYNRKRIGFTFAYNLLSQIYAKIFDF